MDRRSALIIVFFTAAVISPVFAEEAHLEARRLVAEGAIKPLDEIMMEINKQYPGRILEVELEHGEEREYIYEIELLDEEGAVWELEVDAASGELLNTELEE